MLLEPVALRHHGGRLAIAAWGSIAKGLATVGLIVVRALHDGTRGVDVSMLSKCWAGALPCGRLSQDVRAQASREERYPSWLDFVVIDVHRLGVAPLVAGRSMPFEYIRAGRSASLGEEPLGLPPLPTGGRA